MATNNINPNADPGIPVVNNAPLDPSLVASTATVNTNVDPLLNTTQTLIVTTATTNAPTVTTTTNTGTLTQINIINSAVQNFLDTYQGNIGNVYHADVATFANTVPYTGVIGRPDLSVVATTGSFNDLKDLPPQFNLTGIATEAYVNQTISNVVGSAPNNLNTLNELANALGNDASFSTTITRALANKANVNAIPSLTGYATNVYVDNKTTYANITGKPTIPSRTSNLINDNAFITMANLSSYALSANLPTRTSNLINDSGFITPSSLSIYALNANVPTRVSNLINDTGFITSGYLIPFALSANVPNRVSQLTNDTGFITLTSLGNYTLNGSTIQNNNNDPITLNTGIDSWVFTTTGNLTLPRNTSAVNYANGVSITTPGLENTKDSDTGLMIYDGKSKYTTKATVNPLTGDIKTPGNIVVRGSLTVLGAVSQVQQTTLNVSSHEIVLNDGTTGIPTFDAKLIINRGSSPNVSLRWNEFSQKWQQTRDNSTYIDIPINTTELAEGTNLYFTTARSNTAFDNRLDTKTTSNLTEGTNLYYTDIRANTAFDNRLASKTTSNVAEGTNQYFTNTRARAAISVTGSGSYDSATGVITVTGGVTSVNTKTGSVVLNTNDIAEGTGNLYYTDDRANTAFDNRLTTKTTDNVDEGSVNLYYTDDRANIVFDNKLADKTTDDLSEGSTNLYYTDGRANTAIYYQLPIYTGNISAGNARLGNIITGNYATISSNLITGNANLGNIAVANHITITSNLTSGNANLGNLARANYITVSTNITSANADLGNLTVGNNASISSTLTVSNVTISGKVTGNLVPSDNIVYDLGSSTNRWRDLYLSGSSINLGAQTISANTGGLTVSNLTAANIIATGNLSIAGNLNTGNITSSGNITGANIISSGDLSVVGNVSGATATITGNVSGSNLVTTGNVYSGNVSVTGVINSGSIILVGNVTGGNTIMSGVVTASGNISGANIIAVGGVTAGGNVTGSNFVTIGNIFAGNLTLSGGIQSTGSIVGGSIGTTGTVSATGNITGGNIVTTNIISGTTLTISGNISSLNANLGNLVTASYFSGSGSLLTSITGGNVVGQVGNALIAGTVYASAQSSITSLGTLTVLNVSGNIRSANANLGNLVTANYYQGDGSLLTNIAGVTVTGNVGNANSAGTSYYANVANSVAWTNVTNKPTTVSGFGITDSYSNSNVASYLILNPPVSSYSNSSVASYLPTYTGNIKSGNANLGNLVYANYHQGDGSLLTSLTGANVTGNVSNANFAGTAYYANVANSITWNNISSKPNTISGFGITDSYGNSNVSSYLSTFPPTGTYSNSNVSSYLPTYTGNITASSANVGNLIIANFHQGTLTTAAQPNITSVGNLTGLVIANLNANTIFTPGGIVASGIIQGSNITGNGYSLSGITGSNVTGQVANAILAGAVYTNAQPNITSVGSLTGLTLVANGNITLSGTQSNISGANLISATNISGNLITSSQPGITSLGSLTGLTLAANGNIRLIGTQSNISGANLISSNYFSGKFDTLSNAQPNITSVGTLTSLSVSGNVTGGNLNTSGQVNAASTVNSTGAGTGALIVAGGASIAKDLFVGGTLYSANLAFVNSTTLNANSALLYLQASPTYPYNYETGFYSHFATSAGNSASNGYQHTGFVRNHIDNYWYLFSNIATEPEAGLVDLSNAAIVYDNVKLGAVISYGNITSINANLGNLVFANYHQGNGSLLTSITGANVIGQVANALIAGTVTTNAQPNITSVGTLTNLTVTANGNITLSGSLSQISGVNSISATYFVGNGSQLTGLPASYANTNVQAYLPTYTGNLTAGNINLSYSTTSTANLGNVVRANYFIGDGSLLTGLPASYANSNVQAYLPTYTGNLTAGNITAGTLIGLYSNGNSNVNIITANGNVTISATGVNNVVTITGTGVNVAGTLNTGTGNISGGNISGGNISGGNLVTSNYFSGSGNLLSNIQGANVSGAVNLANYASTANAVAGANVTGQVANALIAGTVTTNAQPNITSVGTLTSLGVTGNITSGNLTVSGIGNIGYGQVSEVLKLSNSASAADKWLTFKNLYGEFQIGTQGNTGAYLYNAAASPLDFYTGSLKRLTIANTGETQILSTTTSTSNSTGALQVSGGVGVKGNINADSFTGNGSLLTSLTGGNVSGQVGNALIAGTVYTNAQPNITSVGTLSSTTIGANSNITMSGLLSQISGVNSISTTYLTTGANGNIAMSGSLSQLSGANLISANYFNVTANGNITMSGSLSQISGVNSISVAHVIHSANGNVTMSGSLSNISGANLISANYISAVNNINLSYTTTSTANLGNAVRANYFIGDGSLLTGLPAVYANSNVATFLASYGSNNITTTGNINAGNLIGIHANGNTNLNIPTANGNVTMSVTGVSNVVVITNTGVNVAGTLNTGTGNISGGNATVTGQLTSTVATGTAPFSVISTTRVSNLNVERANISDYNNITAQTTGTFYPVFATGSANGSYILGANPNLSFNAATGALTANTITAGAGSGGTIVGANLISANYFNVVNSISFNPNINLALTGPLSQVSGANLISATYISGNLITNAQPNITSVGTLANLTITTNGNINMSGSISQITGVNSISAAYFVGSGSLLTSITGTSVSGQVGNALLSGTVYTNAQPNITSVGTLSSLSVSGTGSVTGANLVSANYLTGTLTTAAQPNITSVGLLSNLIVGNTTANTIFGNGTITLTSAGSISGGNVVSATYLTGTLTTATQTSITSVGQLTGLTITANGNITLSGSQSNISGANAIQANYFKGDGSGLTGLPPSYSNTQTSAYLSSGLFSGSGVVANIGNLTVPGNITVNSWLTEQQTTEVLNNLGTLSTSVVTCSLSTGATFYFSGITTGSNFTINFTNVPTTTERTIVATVIVAQGFIGYNPAGVQIEGVSQSLKWMGGSVYGTSNGVDVFTFALIRTGSVWAQVLGSGSGFQ
jgi:hypothetical protein